MTYWFIRDLLCVTLELNGVYSTIYKETIILFGNLTYQRRYPHGKNYRRIQTVTEEDRY